MMPKVTITVSAENEESMVQAVLDLSAREGISVAAEGAPSTAPVVLGTTASEAFEAGAAPVKIEGNPERIEVYLRHICMMNKAVPDSATVWITYSPTSSDSEAYTCEVYPQSIQSSGTQHIRLLHTKSPSNGLLHPFFLANITAVKGPAL